MRCARARREEVDRRFVFALQHLDQLVAEQRAEAVPEHGITPVQPRQHLITQVGDELRQVVAHRFVEPEPVAG